ncbi:MAG: FtsX-like permease family protein [Anaerolineae bacterium]
MEPASTSLWPLLMTSMRRAYRRPFQYILFIVGVAIGVAMMVSIDLANSSATKAFELSTDAITGRATHRLIGGPAGLDQEFYVQLRRELGYTNSAPVVEGFVNIPELGGQPYRLVGIDPFAEPPFRNYFGSGSGAAEGGGRFDQGALQTFISQPNTLFVLGSLADEYGVELGGEVTLDRAGENTTVVLAGLLDPQDESNRRALETIIFSDISTAQEILRLQGNLSHIDLIAENESDLAAIRAILPDGVRLENTTASSNAIQQMTAAFELNLTALSLLALLVGMFLIYNTVTFSVVQRRPMFAILRCLGVTGGQLFQLILVEAIILSLIGSLFGLLLGILLGRGMVGLITQTINSFYFVVNVRSVLIDPLSLARGVTFGVAAALIASFFPALEAYRTTPGSGLRRSTLESKVEGLLPRLVMAWAVLCGIGAILLALPGRNLVLAFAGLFAILIGFALITPPVTVWLMRAAVRPMESLFGAIGRMAPRDINRSLSRTSVAIAALMTAVSVIVGVSIMIGSFRGTVVEWLNQTLQADVYVSPTSATANRVEGSLNPDVVADLTSWPGITTAATSRIVSVFVPQFEREMTLAGVSGDISRGNRPYAWLPEGWTHDDVWEAIAAGEGIIVSEPLILREELSYPPEPITIETDSGPIDFPVVGVIYDYSSDQGMIWMGSEAYQQFWNDSEISTVAMFVEDGVDPDQMVDEMRKAFVGRQDLVINSNRSLRETSIEIFDQTFAITSALRLLATLVAFIGVLSALMSLQLERVRELGVLRATGMTLRQMWQLSLLETGLMGLVAGLIAIPTGFVLAWVLIYVINVRSFGWTLQMDLQPAYFLQALAVALVAALLAAIYPSFKLGQMVIATAIRSD